MMQIVLVFCVLGLAGAFNNAGRISRSSVIKMSAELFPTNPTGLVGDIAPTGFF